MRQFKKGEGSASRITYGAAVAAALKPERGLGHLIQPVRDATDELEAAFRARSELEIDARGLRLAVKKVDELLMRDVRSLYKCLESIVGMKKSALARELFPRGLRHFVDVRGATRLKRAMELRRDLRESTEEGADELRAIREERLVAAIDAMREALAEAAGAEAKQKDAFAAECRARERQLKQMALVDAGFRTVDPLGHKRRRQFWRRVEAAIEGR